MQIFAAALSSASVVTCTVWLSPVAPLTSSAILVVANAKVPANDLRELIALAKREPGKLSYGSSGNGTAPHLAGEMFKAGAGVDILHVPYRGGAPLLNSNGNADLADDTHLITSGIVDSTGMLEVITFLEREYGVQVEDRETTPENLATVERLDAFVARKLAAAEGSSR